MTVLGFLFTVFVLYLAYRLIFDFILPIYRTTRRVRQGFREMQERMNEQVRQQQPQQQAHKDDKMSGLGEYIDFEEVK